ncbi:MAG: B12-binding domain-containing radical SAM protein [Phycisphaerales bacterium]|nr:B12-binding domain-containing radical SAM protein [Phycisphaerales bacterium]
MKKISLTRKIRIGFYSAVSSFAYEPGFRPLAYNCIRSGIQKEFPSEFEVFWVDDLDSVNIGVGENADVLLVSSLSQYWLDACKAIKIFRERNPSAWIIVGGHHISHFPNSLPEQADYAIAAEGEIVLPKLLQLLMQSSHPPKEEVAVIPGIIFREKNGAGNSCCSLAERIPADQLVFPDRCVDGYREIVPYLLTSRGCPYKCTFCSSGEHWQRVSYSSIEQVADEIAQIAELYPQLETIPICDDLFVADKDRLKQLHRELQNRDLLGKMSFSANVRADLVDDELCELLKSLNVTIACFGFESATDRILKILKPQGSCSVEQNMTAIEVLHRHGLEVYLSCVLGTPGELLEEARATCEVTLQSMREGKVKFVAWNILCPMPGTYFWEWGRREGVLPQEDTFDWSRLSVYADWLHSRFNSFAEWRKARTRTNAVYLAEATLPQQELLDMLEKMDSLRAEIVV